MTDTKAEPRPDRKPIVNIVTVVRQQSDYVTALMNQLDSLSERHCAIGRICIVHDLIPEGVTPAIAEWSRRSGKVTLVPEAQSDARIEDRDAKARQWASIGNQGIEAALQHESEFVLWVESDLCFPSDLLDQLVPRDVDVIAPLVFLGGVFYDSWGFRDLAGNKLFSFPVGAFPPLPVELSSVGSCVLFRTAIFREGIRFRGTHADGLLVGVCSDARQRGFRVWADPAVSIVHPTSHWLQQVWQVLQAIVIDEAGGTRTYDLSHAHVPGFYGEFVMDFLKQDRRVVDVLPEGVFDLTVVRDPRLRALKLVFESVSAPPGTPAGSKLIRKLSQFVDAF